MRLNASGAIALIATAALIVGGVWFGLDLYRRAKVSERRADLPASERITTSAEVVRIQRRGGGNDRRSVVHYRYVAGDQAHTGATTVRRQDRDRYVTGSHVGVTYLASEPDMSWVEGYTPRTRSTWPAVAVPAACILAALGLVLLIRLESNYNHGKKQPPAVGAAIPIVYDRDQPSRHRKYPLSLVAVKERS